jgi:hypothetical protein
LEIVRGRYQECERWLWAPSLTLSSNVILIRIVNALIMDCHAMQLKFAAKLKAGYLNARRANCDEGEVNLMAAGVADGWVARHQVYTDGAVISQSATDVTKVGDESGLVEKKGRGKRIAWSPPLSTGPPLLRLPE